MSGPASSPLTWSLLSEERRLPFKDYLERDEEKAGEATSIHPKEEHSEESMQRQKGDKGMKNGK